MTTRPPNPDDYQVWECRIVVPAGAELPRGFDAPPRSAAQAAVAAAGIDAVACFSGWGGKPTAGELSVINALAPPAAEDPVLAATLRERARCLEHVQWCRENAETDLRSVRHRIQCGETVEQLEQL